MSKKRNFRYICPCCYGSIDMNQIHYACRNPACAGTFLSSCSEVESRRYGSAYVSSEEVDVEKSEYLGLDPRGPSAVTTKYHIIRGSVNGTCEQCNSKNTSKLCPRCHTIISKGAEKYGTAIYVVTGSENAGKSHYLASAINILRNNYSREFEIDVRASSEKTTLKFDREYHKTVFEDGKCLPPTPTYDSDSSREPLLYDLCSPKDDEPHTVAFLDTSGRDLDTSDKLASLNISTYISEAAGIFFLIDPLQIPAVREGLGITTEEEIPSPTDRLLYIAEIIRDKNKLKPRDRIDIPLAIVLTKSDLLLKGSGAGTEDIMFGPESSLHIAREYGSPDLENIVLVGSEIHEFLRRTLGEEFMDAVRNFSNNEYFAVSALGGETAEGCLTKGVTPSRVEDPLIWFFNEDRRRRF